MLVELRVRQLGVIDDLTLEFGPGMTALTGETGAGKTLLVEALELLLGQRAQSGIVRTGEPEALVEGRFIDASGREVVIARAVPVSGRSRCWVDGRMAPLAALTDMAGQLCDIYGQGEHQALLQPATQRRALDAFGGIDASAVEEFRRTLSHIRRRLGQLGGDPHERARDQDVLAHQVAEIEGSGLDDPGEDEALRAEEERLSELGSLRAAAAQALGALDTDGRADGAVELLGAAVGALDGREALGEIDRRLRGVQADLADLASELRGIVETWEDDPERLEAIHARRRDLADLYRKYGGDRAATIEFATRAKERLERLERADAEVATLEAERRATAEALADAEAALLEQRQATAPRLARSVESRLGDLAMAGARFEVDVLESGSGESVTFLFGANAGEALRPLAKSASGGELARTMLALRLVARGGPPTMVFDEVDAGVGGSAALALAGALREVATDHQVLVVTHLAQVAAFANHQVSVRKVESAGRVVTVAETLATPARVVELSRMLSGQPDSQRARAHAEELLELAQHDPTPSAPVPPSKRSRSIRV